MAAEALCLLGVGVQGFSSVGYWVGGVHRDPISEEYCRPCCLGTGFLLGSLIGKAFNGVAQIHGGKEDCFDSYRPRGGR